jgi:DNA-binding CsgD family transcriptional regulator
MHEICDDLGCFLSAIYRVDLEGSRVSGSQHVAQGLAPSLPRQSIWRDATRRASGRPASVCRLPTKPGSQRSPVCCRWRGVTSAHDSCHWPRPPSSSPVSSKHLQPKLTPFGLIPAETRVLERLLRDMSLVAAAAALGIAETTAKTHLSRIFAKTGVSRQPELVALVHRLLPPLRRE